MMPQLPPMCSVTADTHRKWLQTIAEIKNLVFNEEELQKKSDEGFRLKERSGPPEVIGCLYAKYCLLANRIYDAYLNNVQLQRSPFILDLLKVFMRRVYELRSELVHVIVNDYVYVDGALEQMKLTPQDINVVVPYTFSTEFRPDSIESLLQHMWADAVTRKETPTEIIEKPPPTEFDLFFARMMGEGSEVSLESKNASIVLSEKHIKAVIIQKHERLRQSFTAALKIKSTRRRVILYYNYESLPKYMSDRAAKIIQLVYREYINVKRKRMLDVKRDMLIGLIPKPVQLSHTYKDVNNKMYKMIQEQKQNILEKYTKDIEKEKVRLYLLKKEDQIDDITEQIREWLKEWYYGYGFFPQYPFEIDGGTILVIRSDYVTIKEKITLDEKYNTSSKDQIKQNKKLKNKAEAYKKKREAAILFRLRCNPLTDPGYKPHVLKTKVSDELNKYLAFWNNYDHLPPEEHLNTIYGYLKELLTEEVMLTLHIDCRKYVDTKMRLEMKLLIKSQMEMYKRLDLKFPKMKAKKPRKLKVVNKPLIVDEDIQSELQEIFYLEIITKPENKLNDIWGDLNYAAYNYNIMDPIATFPPPCYGDLKHRITLSCIHSIGFTEGAKKNKAVLLIGQPCNGKSFIVDAICGEINAVKIDISPEVLNVKISNPDKKLAKAFLAARAFQPAVVFLKNIERVFCKKVLPQDQPLNATAIKKALMKQVKAISNHEKIIFIATCSNPFLMNPKPVKSLFNEMIIVPRLDYGTLQQFFYFKLQRIRSVPRDFCVQSIAKLLEGYGFGTITRLFDTVMTPERVVHLNINPLNPVEFLNPLLDSEIQPMTLEMYGKFTEWFIKHSKLAKERQQYAIINEKRAIMYNKIQKKKERKIEVNSKHIKTVKSQNLT